MFPSDLPSAHQQSKMLLTPKSLYFFLFQVRTMLKPEGPSIHIPNSLLLQYLKGFMKIQHKPHGRAIDVYTLNSKYTFIF